MSNKEHYPDANSAAEEIRKSNDDLGVGVQTDILADAAMTAQDAHAQVQDIYVTLDGVCDNLGLIPDPVQSDLHQMQRDAKAAAIWLNDFEDAIGREYSKVRNNE